jgi:protein-S-isoprenylcysteine O-methyltransferase Ste14
MPKTVRPIEGSHRRFSDWFGCIFFVAFALFLLRRAPHLGLLMLPSILHEMLTAACFLLRGRAKTQLSGLGPRLAAYGGSFLMPGLMIAQTTYHPGWLRLSSSTALLTFALFLWLAGIPLILFGMWNLRRSFSIEPQARQLVTGGLYSFARHPIYTGYLFQYLGISLANMNMVLGVATLIWLGLVMMRIHFEETVLSASFPEYAAYRREVGMFGPWFLGNTTSANLKAAKIPPAV